MGYEYKFEAQPVYYNNCKTNSKLEARYMVFYDAFGAEYVYEPELFKMKNGILYRPDFLLTNVKWKYGNEVYCEIKGTDDFSKIKIEDQVKMLTFAEDHPLLVFGNLPHSVEDVFNRDAGGEKDIFAMYYGHKYWTNVFFEKIGNQIYIVNKEANHGCYYECNYALAKARLTNFSIM